ncbi:MAG: methyltransferase domain-containing protein [Nitrospirota bacterium]
MKETSNYRKYTSKNPVQRFLIGNFLNALFGCLDGIKIDNILDAGCGEGFILSEFKKRGVGKVLEGVDCSENALETGRKIFPSLILKTGDIYSLPYDNDLFDLVICTEVLEHLKEPGKVLDEVVRVSRKYCLLSVPNEPLFMISNFLRGKNISRWGNDAEHLQHWGSRCFKNFIENKLKVMTVKSPFPWTIVLGRKE